MGPVHRRSSDRQFSVATHRLYFGQSILASDAIEPIDRYMQYDFDGYLSDGINTKVDIASMMHSLEVRAPFLDHRLVEFAARLPATLKQHGPKGRVLYKKAVAPHVPAGDSQSQEAGVDAARSTSGSAGRCAPR